MAVDGVGQINHQTGLRIRWKRIAVEPGTVAQLELEFSEEAPEGGIYTGYVYAHEEGWHINPNIFYQEQFRSLTFELQDGGIGDADGVVNGIIVSP